MEKKRICFKDFWSGFFHDDKATINFWKDLFTEFDYEFEIVDTDPDIIIFSLFGDYNRQRGQFHKKTIGNNSKKCFYTGENHPAIKEADLNLTFENTSDHNNIRLPLWILYGYEWGETKICDWGEIKNMKLVKKDSEGFCCFVYSNQIEHRNAFCRQLSK